MGRVGCPCEHIVDEQHQNVEAPTPSVWLRERGVELGTSLVMLLDEYADVFCEIPPDGAIDECWSTISARCQGRLRTTGTSRRGTIRCSRCNGNRL